MCIKKTLILTLGMAVAVLAQTRSHEQFFDSLTVPKNFENYNEFQVDKWGPITYSGVGKCDILDLYQKSVEQNLGYSTVVDYHFKQAKFGSSYTCESWGLGLSFKVSPDTSKYSEDYELPPNKRMTFSARSKDAIKKFFDSDSAFLEIESITPVTFQAEDECHEVDFLFNVANEQSGFHGIIDIKSDEAFTLTEGKKVCTFWGLAVKYKHREVIEKAVTKKRIIEVITVPPPKPDTVFVPTEKPAAKKCCLTCCCDN